MNARSAPLSAPQPPGHPDGPANAHRPRETAQRAATDPGTPARWRRRALTDTEQALAHRIQQAAQALRDQADDDGLSIAEAVELAAIQIGRHP